MVVFILFSSGVKLNRKVANLVRRCNSSHASQNHFLLAVNYKKRQREGSMGERELAQTLMDSDWE